MNRRLLLTLIVVVVITACAPAAVQPQPTVKLTAGYGSDSSMQAVGVNPFATIHDARRNKDLSISVDYPIYRGPFPTLLFSPRSGGSAEGYRTLAFHLM